MGWWWWRGERPHMLEDPPIRPYLWLAVYLLLGGAVTIKRVYDDGLEIRLRGWCDGR